jgi:hypothetical protein
MRLTNWLCLLALSAAHLGCGSDPEPDSHGGTKLMSDNGTFALSLSPKPNPPVAGDNELDIVLSDAHGDHVQGAEISIETWMPSMGHGSGVVPDVSEVGGGVYHATHLTYSMPGAWQLRFAITAGGATDHATAAFDVQ